MDGFSIRKYPRTPHLEGSRLQPGDEDLSQVRFATIAGRHLVVEEKVDGANSAVSFDADGRMLLQSRGHYLTGGPRERHYDLMKQWAAVHEAAFRQVLGSRYVMYGEWMYAKHTVFYDSLPHYFIEFDVLDRETGTFLDTPSRRELLGGLPVVSAPVLSEGEFQDRESLLSLIGTSRFVSGDQEMALRSVAQGLGLDPDRACRESELSGTMEGIYIKIEEDGHVTDRLKFVRAQFSQCIDLGDTHWLSRPIIPNQLAVPFELLFM